MENKSASTRAGLEDRIREQRIRLQVQQARLAQQRAELERQRKHLTFVKNVLGL